MALSAQTPPVVSVVMAAHNAGPYIGAAMASVLGQSLHDLELIVSDDGSTDDTLTIARAAAARDARVRVITVDRPNGPGAARNRAFAAARGTWLAIVDADDLIHPCRFERLLAAADGIDMVADDLIRFGAEDGQCLLTDLGLVAPWNATAADLLAAELGDPSVPVGYLKPMIRQAALGPHRYREEMTVGEDFDLLLRLTLAGAKLRIVPQGYYLYRRHPGSISHRLSQSDVAGMVAAAAALSQTPDLSPHMTGLFAIWQRRLARQAAFATLIEALRAGQVGGVARALARSPNLIRPLADATLEGLSRRMRGAPARAEPVCLTLPWDADSATPAAAARLVAQTGQGTARLRVEGSAGLDALGYVPGWANATLIPPQGGWSAAETARIAAMPWPVTLPAPQVTPGRAYIRTPTFRRPDTLRRALTSLMAQTHQDWVCDVFDDDPTGSAHAVVDALADPRIRYNANATRLFAAANIDRCFSRANPHGCEFFCMLDDDSVLSPTYLAENIQLARTHGVEIVFRNQRVETDPGTPAARVSRGGLLDRRLTERVYSPEHFRLALMADIGVSNGGLFWSHRAQSDLEVRETCSATLQEYYRTFAIAEPIFVAMTPLRSWAQNGAATGRNAGDTRGWFQRELSLKASVARLQRQAWLQASPPLREAFLEDAAFSYPRDQRARGLVKAGLRLSVKGALPLRDVARLALRGLAIRLAGRPQPRRRAFRARWRWVSPNGSASPEDPAVLGEKG